MQWKNTLMAYEEDIKNKSFWDWLKAHTSFMKPLHRYRGNLNLGGENLVFSGKDVKKKISFFLEIPYKNILDVFLGFDDIFKRREDRQIGLFGFMPLIIRYKLEEGEKSLYIFANFHHSLKGRTSDNKEVYEELKNFC